MLREGALRQETGTCTGRMAKDKNHKKERKKSRKRERDSSEERDRAAKLAKKVTRHLQKHSGAGHGYTDTDNPFGDSNVNQKFVWNKKIEKQIHAGTDIKELTARAEQQRQQARLEEIEKVQERRAQRERERAEQEEMQQLLQRERGMAEAMELEAKEEAFHLDQALFRAKTRIREGRAKPIDIAATSLHLTAEFEPEQDPPYQLFEGLSLEDMQEFHHDILEFQELDVHDAERRDFWQALMTVCERELQEAVKQDHIDRARLRGEPVPEQYLQREQGLHSHLDQDVQGMLAGKTHAELQALQASIEQQLAEGAAADPEYWEAVLRRLRIHKARARLREIHVSLLRKHVDRVEHVGEGVDVAREMGWGADDAAAEAPDGDAADTADDVAAAVDADEEAAAAAPAAAAAAPQEEEEEFSEDDEPNVGQWSPPPLDPKHTAGRDVIPEAEDEALLNLLRKQVRQHEASRFRAAAAAQAGVAGASSADRAYHQQMMSDDASVHPMMRYLADAAPQRGEATMRSGRLDEAEPDVRRFKALAERQMGDAAEAGDIAFGGEVDVPADTDANAYWWHEQYRPRRPKYFNRVHTGYEWNKYNQSHYDHDNPPPKVVQGYKFNIFYPDLIDKEVAPTFTTKPDPQADEQSNTCLLVFHAGPPYEDVAFRIIAKDWEYSHKKGYKCTFERGILHLYFNFKRARYRR